MSSPFATVARAAADGRPSSMEPAPRRAVLCAGGFVLSLGILATVTLLSLRIGSVPISTTDAIEAFTAFDGSNEHLIVRRLRLPRTIIGLGVGGSLAVGGVALQAVARNALASPTVLGVNAGATFAIATAVFFLDVVTPSMYVWFAFVGAMVAMLIVFSIATAGRGGATPVKIALAGAVVTAMMYSWVNAILVVNQRTLDEVRFWMVGSLVGRGLDVFAQVAIVTAILGAPVLVHLVRSRRLGEL